MTDERFAVQRTQITRVGRLRTALMLTDIVGYTRRMHADESSAVDELRQHNTLIRKQLEVFHGREVKTIGDAFLCEFPVADDALNCALAIQQQMEQAFTGLDPLRIRIGLHVAEVEAIGPDVIGDGVNILSRIEPQAQPGGICASKEFLDAIAAQPVPFFSMGPVAMKSIDQPMELFAWPADEQRPSQSTDPDQAGLPPTHRIRAPRTGSAQAVPVGAEDEGPTILHRALPELSGPPVRSKNARPLSKSSGIFSPRKSLEAFPETATVVVPEDPPSLLSDVPAMRGGQVTHDAPPSDDGTITGPPPQPEPFLDEPGDAPTGSLTHPPEDLPEVVIPPPHRPRGGLIAVGVVGGIAVAAALVAIGLIVGHAAKKTANPDPTVTTVHVAPPPAPAPAPLPAPVVAAPPKPAPPPVVEPPKPAKPPTLDEVVARARENLNADKHLKPKRRKQLLGDLGKLDKKWKHARAGKDKQKAEKALREYLKKHHLP